MEKDNLCLKCPIEVRGYCCCSNLHYGGFNILLDNVPCPQLDTETGTCKDYENRGNYAWCLPNEVVYGLGGLPEGCLYVKEDPSREPKPKRLITKIIEGRSKRIQKLLLRKYALFNVLPFNELVKYSIRKEVKA